MDNHIPTGQGAQLLGVTEPRLSETVRRGKVSPPPRIVAGRRLWSADHLIQAAEALGVLTTELQQAIEAAAPRAGAALSRYSSQPDPLVQVEQEGDHAAQ